MQANSPLVHNSLLAALLHVTSYKFLGIVLEHFVYFIQKLVQLCLQFVALLGLGGDSLNHLVAASRRLLPLLLTFCHSLAASYADPSASRSCAGLSHSCNNLSTCAAVPLSGSIIGTRRSGSEPRSKTSESQLAAAMEPAHFCRHRPRKYARVVVGGLVMAETTASSDSSRSKPHFSYRDRPGRTSWYCRSRAASLWSPQPRPWRSR